MSRILRRPMFRGGPVDSRGTGITSNLGYENGGRVGFATGGDFFRKYILGPKTGGIGTQLQRDRALQSTLLPPGATEQDRFKMFADLVSEQETGTPITGDTGLAPSYLTGTEFYEQAYGADPSAAEGLLASIDTVGAGKKVGEEEASEVSIRPKTGIEKLDKIDPVENPKINTKDDPDEPEVTMSDLERALGLDRARREYAEDALAAASKAFFEGRGFEAIADAAQVKSKAPDIKRLAGLEEFKAKKAKELFRERLDAQARAKAGTMGNLQKDIQFLKGLRGADRVAALKKLGYDDPSLSAAIQSLIQSGRSPDPSTIKNLAELYIGPDFAGVVDVTEELSTKTPGTYIFSDGSALVIIGEKGTKPKIQKLS